MRNNQEAFAMAKIGPGPWESFQKGLGRETSDAIIPSEIAFNRRSEIAVNMEQPVEGGIATMPQKPWGGKREPVGEKIGASQSTSRITPLTEVAFHLLNGINTNADGDVVDESGNLLPDETIRRLFSPSIEAERKTNNIFIDIQPTNGSPVIGGSK